MGLTAAAPARKVNPWAGADYDTLVAAHLLRSKRFLSTNADLIARSASVFFGNFALDDIVRRGLDYWRQTGKLAPQPVLVEELRREGRPGVSIQVYAAVLERAFSVPLEGEEHIQATLLERVQERLLADLAQRRPELSIPEYFRKVRDVEALSYKEDAQLSHLLDDLDDLLLRGPTGMPTGFPPLDRCLDNGGIGPGELFLVIGDPNIGKTQLLHHLARQAAIAQRLDTLVVSLETSHRNTRMRILRGATGWTRDQVYADPKGFRGAVDALGPIPLHVRYTSGGGGYGISSLAADVERIQQRTGRKIGFIIRDYGEKMVGSREWQVVRQTYDDFKALLGRLEVPGADAAQCNKAGDISNYDLLKDADIGLRIREESKDSNILLAEIVRIREGTKGSLILRADRPTGRMEMFEIDPHDLVEDA